jgi:Ca2+-transporting ATPase
MANAQESTQTVTSSTSEAFHPWAAPAEEVARAASVDLRAGLSSSDAARRMEQHGPNRLREAQGRTPLQMFLSQFADLVVWLLLAAALLSTLIGEWADAVLIGLIVVANAIIGFLQEWKAEKAIAALKQLSQPVARVWRDGHLQEVSATDVVPGDLIELITGSRVPADSRLVEVVDLQTDEAPLTGESLPIDKSIVAEPPETPLPDRTCMVYAGTAVTTGHGRAIVIATGMATELGKIAHLLEQADAGQTPLQQRLASLSRKLAVVVITTAVVVFAAGVLRENISDWDQALLTHMLLTAVSLAVATIPEGLPAVITVALARGSQQMASRRALIRRLAAVETLGSVDVICSDKTGTLTEGRMSVSEIVPYRADRDDFAEQLLRGAVLCNNAEISPTGDVVGAPTEAALLRSAIAHELDPRTLRHEWPREDELPFSSERKRMTTLHRSPSDGWIAFTKGAVEGILERCTAAGIGHAAEQLDDAARKKWLDEAERLAMRGRRVLAVAARKWNSESLPDDAEAVERDLGLLGLIAIVDPVRREVTDAIRRCQSAGIRPVMITGDHPSTARAIADDLGLMRDGDRLLIGVDLDRMSHDQLAEAVPTVAVYARVSPEHKLRIVRALQATGTVTAMTGDGVNDAPALKQADVGVAMGITGTDGSKEAAAMVLADDNFATIVAAIEEGRVVYDNIRKFVRFLLTSNAVEILVLFFAIVLGWPLPLLPAQILWINLVTDGLPALALGYEPAEPDVMRRRPVLRDDSLLGGTAWQIGWPSVFMAVTCLALFRFGLSGGLADPSEGYSRTLVFFTLVASQLFFALAVRSPTQTIFTLGQWSNWRLAGAVVMGLALQLLVVYVPELQSWFHTVALSPRDLGLAVLTSLGLFACVEAGKLATRRSHDN